MILPFNKLDDFQFQSVIPKFSIGELKLKVKSVEDLYNNKPFTLNNINANTFTDISVLRL